MPPSVAEIITFPVSEAYHTDSSTTAADLIGVLHKAPRPTRIYHGPQVEDPSQGYLVTVWETYDQTRATLASSLHFDVHHVQFAADPTSALSAPVVELVFFTLKEGKTKSEIAPHLDTLVSQDTKTVISSMWGHSIGRDNQLVMLVGWESLEAHQEVVKNTTEEIRVLFGRFMELSEFKVSHAKFNTEADSKEE